MKPALVRVLTAGLAVSSAAPSLLAQWSSNPAANLKIADRSGEQVQPKIRPTADGGCYVSWFDNATGGYDVYLQRLSAQGVEQWAHNGILLADRAVSSTVDYDLSIDNQGNAVIAYNDDGGVSGATQQIAVQKVNPSGTKLWGPTGVTVSSGADFKANPHLAVLTDDNIVVSYSDGPSGAANQFIMQKLDSTGVPLWAAPGVTVNEAAHYVAPCDLKSDGAGGVIALWIRGSNASPTTSSKALYTQRYNGSGAPQWNAGSPVIVFNTTSVQNGYFPPFIADGAGGAVFGWYEIGGSRNAYIQHVLANGSFKFAAPIANTGVTAGRIRIEAGLGYNAATGEYYLASTESGSPTQGSYTVIAQKYDTAGNRLWTDSGTLVSPVSGTNQPSFVQCQPFGDGCMVFFLDTRSATTRVVSAARVVGNGSMPWSPSVIQVNNDSSNDKARLASCMSTSGFAMLAYGWGNTGSADIAVQNINGDGTLGLAACYPNCDGSTTAPVLNVLDFACFLNQFASGNTYANCDASTTPPVLNVLDFACFLNLFASGCT